MVKLIVGIEACSSPFSVFSGCIWWIDEKGGGLLRSIFLDQIDAVALYKADLIANVLDIGNSLA